MSVEPRRGCGFRKIGGLYLVSDRGGVVCDRLPIPLEVCPTCGHGIKQARGWTWVLVAELVGIHPNCADQFPCPLCMAPADLGKAGLLWIGEKFYKTPHEFDAEAKALGISRRIAAIPRGFKVGETWILLAHPKALERFVECKLKPGQLVPTHEREDVPGIFKVWRPQRLEKILGESDRGSAQHLDCIEKGITPVFVPDADPDHRVGDDDEENGESKS